MENCPLSNQMLSFFRDIRTHPLITFLNLGIPVSINSDDSGYFSSYGVSFDYFSAVVALELDLLDIK